MYTNLGIYLLTFMCPLFSGPLGNDTENEKARQWNKNFKLKSPRLRYTYFEEYVWLCGLDKIVKKKRVGNRFVSSSLRDRQLIKNLAGKKNEECVP